MLIVATDEIVVGTATDLRCHIVVGEIVDLSHRVNAVVVAIDHVDAPVRAGRVGREAGVDAGVLREIGDVGRDVLVVVGRRWLVLAVRYGDVVVIDGRVGLEDGIGLEVISHHHHGAGTLADIDDQRGIDTEVAAQRGPLADPVSGVRQFFRLGRRRRLRWPFLQLAVDIVAGGHRVRIRRAAAVGPDRVVGGQEIRGPAIGLRHLPVDGNLGVGVGRQLLDGGHRIAVEMCDQGFNHG